MSKRTDKQLEETIKAEYTSGISAKQISKKYGIHHTSVYRIINRNL